MSTNKFIGIIFAIAVLFSAMQGRAQTKPTAKSHAGGMRMVTDAAGRVHKLMQHVTPAEREAAAKRRAAQRAAATKGGVVAPSAAVAPAAMNPGGVPDYFGTTPNYANSPFPDLVNCGAPAYCGMRKFVDQMPNIPIATPDTTTYSGSDYYEIELREYTAQMHSDLRPTTLRGYVQVNGPSPAPIQYLGPIILAHRDRPVRVKFTNKLSTGAGGNLFIPVDTTYMGAGMGPAGTNYTENRATLHLHGGTTPWISDGTPHQWTTPAGESTPYPQGVSIYNVPDMPNPGDGSLTFFYSNQQSARLMFYHDHAYGITRLNVYAGEAAGYLLTDQVEQDLINGTNLSGVNPNNLQLLPGFGIPLVIQDKTFIPSEPQMAAQDPTWPFALDPNASNLWFPHVYMPNQNPYDVSGANAMGRWDYGPWFWPPFTNLQYGPVANPLYGAAAPWEPPFNPGTPEARGVSPSGVPESFMDTPVVNGKAYPFLNVPAGVVRFRILNAANDRFVNLSFFAADPTVNTPDGRSNTEVSMVPFNTTQNASAPFPAWWYDATVPNPFDDRVGGVPDPATRGPAMIQIATEGGLLPAPVIIRNQPVNYVMNKRDITVGNVAQKALFLGPAERADVLVDFSNFAGKTLILYNDSPAPVPAADPRLDYFTGDPDETSTGGAPSTIAGFGPNTRTVMQVRVGGSGGAGVVDDVNNTLLSQLQTILPKAFAASQDTIIVPQDKYNAVYNATLPSNNYVRISDNTFSFTPIGATTPVIVDLEPKSIIEDFQMDYARMNAMLGVELKHTNNTQQTSVPQAYIDPPTEVVKVSDTTMVQVGATGLTDGTQIWKITHNGVDTHAIHVHMFNLQVVNRVGWDGAIRPPDANELGWKDTARMNPLEDIIVAVRPIMLKNLPWPLPNSVRPLDVTQPVGTLLSGAFGPSFGINPAGNPVSVLNTMTNFGWEYVWHCHLLGHEENDMMRAMAIAVPPEAPSGLTATGTPGNVNLTWTDNSVSEAGFTVQISNDVNFTTTIGTLNFSANTVSAVDTTSSSTTLYYRVVANGETVGSSVLGYQQMAVDSAPSNVVSVLGPPIASLSASTLSFANQTVGTTSTAQTVILSNTGASDMTVSISMSGNAGDFSQSGCGTSVAAGANCTISVAFTPTVIGLRNAGVVIKTNDPANPTLTVSLSGTGTNPSAGVSPMSVNFGNQIQGTTSTVQTVTVSNTGNVDLTLGSSTSSPFAIVSPGASPCGTTLATGLTCTVGVTFAPTALGLQNGALTITTNDPAHPSFTVALSGTGIVNFPTAPTLTASVIGPFQVNLTWTPGAGGGAPTGFRVVRTNGGSVVLGPFSAATTAFSDTTVKDGTLYTYQVIAFNSTGDSPGSNVASVTTPLAPPSNLAVAITPVPPLAAVLNWTNNSLTATSIVVQRAGNITFTAGLKTYPSLAPTATTLTANSLTLGSTYCYRVQAVNATGASPWSTPVCFVPTLPAAPSNLQATGVTRTSVSLAWRDNSTIEGGFYILRSRNSAFTRSLSNFSVGANVTAFTDTTASNGTRYYYRVRSFNGGGNSNWSNTINVSTLP